MDLVQRRHDDLPISHTILTEVCDNDVRHGQDSHHRRRSWHPHGAAARAQGRRLFLSLRGRPRGRRSRARPSRATGARAPRSHAPRARRAFRLPRNSKDRVGFNDADHGIGIPEDCQKRIFERFYRIDKDRSRALGGTGLGLAIVKHIAQLHGGEVAVRSKPGAGATFTLTI